MGWDGMGWDEMGWDGRTDLVCDCSLVKTILMYRRDVF
jgi:hypothetical protein